MSFDFAEDPFRNLALQLEYAEAQGVSEPTAMTLATANEVGVPSARIVLYKGFLDGGLAFFTNYDSPKAQDLKTNPKASLLFYWAPLFQQIRISGVVKKLSAEQSDEYFATRARLSQLGAWASRQSAEIPDLNYLANKVNEIDQRFHKQNVPRPDNWGGYVLLPHEIEFWFGKDGRLHERYVYAREDVASLHWHRYFKSP